MNSNTNNGPEGADNSPNKSATKTREPSNNFFRQSLYIAAIAKYLGFEGLFGPVRDVHDGIEYQFDFHQPEHFLIKVLHGHAVSEHRKYAAHPKHPLILVDLDGIECLLGEHRTNPSNKLLIIPSEIVSQISTPSHTFVYWDYRIWAPLGTTEKGDLVWIPLAPDEPESFEMIDVEED